MLHGNTVICYLQGHVENILFKYLCLKKQVVPVLFHSQWKVPSISHTYSISWNYWRR